MNRPEAKAYARQEPARAPQRPTLPPSVAIVAERVRLAEIKRARKAQNQAKEMQP